MYLNLTHGTATHISCTIEDLRKQNVPEELIQEAILKQKVDEKRNIANLTILNKYPYWKQLNIIKSDNDPDKLEMNDYIQKIVDWSNDINSTEEDLQLIK